jgi:hypothetical protein
MSRAHIQTGIIIWSAEGECQKRFLLHTLLFHIRGCEKVADGVVRQNFSIKNIHDCVHGAVAANANK